MWVPTLKFLQELMNGDTLQGHDSTAILGNASVGLLRANYAPTINSAITDVGFVEANYVGYGRKSAGAFTKAFLGEVGKVLVQGSALTWQPTGSDTVNTIYGQFLTGNDSTKLLAVEMFNSPIPLPDLNHAFVSVTVIGLDSAGNFGSSIITT